MVLLGTAGNQSQARLQGSRGAGRVSSKKEGEELSFTRQLLCVDSAKYHRHISSGEESVTRSHTYTHTHTPPHTTCWLQLFSEAEMAH